MQQGIQALRERRNALAKTIHDVLDQHPGNKWGPAQQSQYDQGIAEIDAVDAEIGRIQAFHDRLADEAMGGMLKEAGERALRDGRVGKDSLFAKWMRGGDKVLTNDDWTQIRAAMSTTTGAEGGFTVQTEVAKTLLEALKAYGGMRGVAEVFQTAQGSTMNFPTSDGTSETGEQISENTAATDLDLSFGTVSLNVYKYSSKVVAVPIELLQDSQIDIEAFIRGRLVTRIGRITNTKFTVGSGINEPRGVVTAATAAKVGATGQTVTVVFDDLVDLVHAIDPAYREAGRCRFMMSDSAVKVIRKIKDAQNRPIWVPSYDAGIQRAAPDTLLGYPLTVNQDVAPMAANARSILFGDFSYYKIRDVMEATLFRFTDSAYMKRGQVGFLMWSRHGGNYIDIGGAVKYYQNSAT